MSQSSRPLATYVARSKASQPPASWSLEISAGPNDAALYTALAHLEPSSASLLEEISTAEVSVLGSLQGFRNSPHSFQGGAPRLRKLHLEGSYLSSNWPPLTYLSTLYLHQLRRSTRPTWSKFRDLLASTAGLSQLSIHGDFVSGKPPAGLEIEMFQLRFLRIRGTTLSGDRASDLLLIISTPYLESLTLFDMVFTDLKPFLSGFQPTHLTSLTSTPLAQLHDKHLCPAIRVMDRHPADLLTVLGNQSTNALHFPCAQLEGFALYPPPVDSPGGWIEDVVNNRAAHAPFQLLRVGDRSSIPRVQVLPFDHLPQWPAWPEEQQC
ncbi:hypothetical protein DFH09DRAFT_1269309 [Mycena vulgaris]|nr:hypothetical protein DFH09DRAFT_1269309 [Mycena vulgaris]